MKSKIKILLINTQMEKGGAQKAMLSLASNLSTELFDVTVCTMYDKGNFIESFEKDYDLKINNLKMKQQGGGLLAKLFAFLKGLLLLGQIIKKNKIDVVQSYSHTANIIVPLIAFMFGVKVRITSQRMSLDKMSKKVQWLDRLVENSFLVTKLTSVSEGTKKSCIRDQNINPEKIFTIPNGIDLVKLDKVIAEADLNKLKTKLNIEEGQISVITVARLHKQKGHTYYLQAIKKVVKKYPNTKYYLVGHGELQPAIEKYINDNNLANNVVLLGARNDVPALLATCDIFVLPSLWEGMPNTVLEAMGVGMPVIATSVDGTPEIISNEFEGILITPKRVDEIEKALLLLLNDEKLRTDMSSAARQRIEDHFSLNRTTKMFESLYLELSK